MVKKKHYIKIPFPDGKSYIYNQYATYDEKLKIVNEILARWEDYILKNWDKTLIINGSPQRPVIKMLNMLTYYLLYDSDKQLTENNILNLHKEVSVRLNEIPISSCNSNVRDYFYASINEAEDYTTTDDFPSRKTHIGFDKKYKKFQHLKNIDKDFISGIQMCSMEQFASLNRGNGYEILERTNDGHFLIIDINFYTNEHKEYKDEVCKSLIFHFNKLKNNYQIQDCNTKIRQKLFRLAKKSYMNILTAFEKIELIKVYVLNPTQYYDWKWAVVNELNEFEFLGKSYQVKDGYNFDKIICYSQNGQYWFYDLDINLVKTVIELKEDN